MIGNEDFKLFMSQALSLQQKSQILVEWNMNRAENIEEVGNYRNRPNGNSFQTLPQTWTRDDEYTKNATDADVVLQGNVYDEEDKPIQFTSKKEKLKMLYSLDECVSPDRPRSGINKPLYLGYSSSDLLSAQFINNYGDNIDKRPRYYMGHKDDIFKYWTSYRTEKSEEFGVSNNEGFIEDVAPYVVYRQNVPCNRIVVKMQTNVGDYDEGPFRMPVNYNFATDQNLAEAEDQRVDPLYDQKPDDYFTNGGERPNATVPSVWEIQTLQDNDEWVTAATLSDVDVPTDGHVELYWGIATPDLFNYRGELPETTSLPATAKYGDAYLINGSFWIYTEGTSEPGQPISAPSFISWTPSYTWNVAKTDPMAYAVNLSNISNDQVQEIRGIRIVVTEMKNPNHTFDLIEMSPRLIADISERVIDYNITKTMGDMGNTSLPLGSLLASTGTIQLSNNDGIFSESNESSIVSKYCRSNMKFMFAEIIKNQEGKLARVPVKTMYSDGFAKSTGSFDIIQVNLRDAYYKLERVQAPELFLSDVSLSFAIAMLLDYIGFTNYKFYRMPDTSEPVIPFFFVPPDKNVAEILSDLAMSTQSSIWFDEYNNLCVGYKEWMFPPSYDEDGKEVLTRKTDASLYGSNVVNENGEIEAVANIESLAADEKIIANAGTINYTERYIQRDFSSLKQAYNTNQYKSWSYKPTMLWEVSASENLTDYNKAAQQQSSYTLSAVPLSVDLPADPPSVISTSEGTKLVNNVIELGEGVVWLGRPQGYFYAGGEIIKFDAIQYSISGVGTRWITSNDEYQNFLGKLPFNGKIYPTGRVRIYSEPYYEESGDRLVLVSGKVKDHGRAQFGTTMTTHSAGLDDYWKNTNNCYGIYMDSTKLFTAELAKKYPLNLANPDSSTNSASMVNSLSRASTRTGVIKNILADTYQTEKDNQRFGTKNRGTIQASALSFEGPSNFYKEQSEDANGNLIEVETNPVDTISYVYKSFNDNPYTHFGTRMRVVGEITSNSNTKQVPVGSGEYLSIQQDDPTSAVVLLGGSGGIGVQVDPATNNGYFLEIVALSDDVTNGASNNPVYPAKVDIKNKTVTFKTFDEVYDDNGNVVEKPVEHNIKEGDDIIVQAISTASAPYKTVGQWKAQAVTKGTITVRIATADEDYTGTDFDVTVQKVSKKESNVNNVIFYKMQKDPESEVLVPYTLWEGLAEIICDTGAFVDQQRVTDGKSTVYDLGIEFKDIVNNGEVARRTFYLYLNNKNIAIVDDTDPIPNPKNSFALFTRGKSKCMFNNVYAIGTNFANNNSYTVLDNIGDVFGTNSVTNLEALQKYGVSGLVQNSYLQGISSNDNPQYNMYFDEFGTIMRECAYIQAKYDQAYPALMASIAANINNSQSYVTSGFYAGSYGAEFLVFNTTDTAIEMDSSTGAFLRILGVAITSETNRLITVDNYFNKMSKLSNPVFDDGALLNNPVKYKEQWQSVQRSREKYGLNEFPQINTIYLQDELTAESMLGWIISQTHKPKQTIGVNLFGMSHLQLGDIVDVDYSVVPANSPNDAKLDTLSSKDKRYLAYQIQMTKGVQGANQTVYLVEV
jgi:hypothetical protein